MTLAQRVYLEEAPATTGKRFVATQIAYPTESADVAFLDRVSSSRIGDDVATVHAGAGAGEVFELGRVIGVGSRLEDLAVSDQRKSLRVSNRVALRVVLGAERAFAGHVLVE